MAAVALGLAAGISWGLADFLGGLMSRRLHVLTVLIVSQGVGMLAIAALVAARGDGPPEAHFLGYGLAAGLSGLIGLGAFYRGMAVGAMAVVAPISATGAAIPVVVGVATGDRPSTIQAAGLLLALAGVVLASREPAAGNARLAAGTGLALAAAVGFGGFFVGMDAASDGDVMWALLAARSVVLPLLVAIVLVVRARPALDGADARGLIAIGMFDITANAFFALASTEGLVSLVAVLASLYPVVTILLARAVLGERVRRIQAVGVLMALCGVAAIAGG